MLKTSVSRHPHLVWISTISPTRSLDSATWLDTTRELRRLGWDVTLICREEGGRQTVRGVEVLNLGRSQIYLFGQLLFHLRAMLFVLRKWGEVDVVLFHQYSGLWLLPLRLYRWLRRSKRPLLTMDTRDLFDYRPGDKKVRLQMFYDRVVRRLAERWFDGQTTITPQMAELVHIPAGQLWGIWPSGVNPGAFAAASRARSWPQGDEPIHLIYIGMLAPNRNLLPLCHAVSRANREGMAFELSLYGNGKMRPAIEEIAAGEKNGVRLRTPVPHERVPQILAEAHVGVTSLPAPDDKKYQASSPIKLFEYMAAGMPMLATCNVCHTNVVQNGEYVFWADDASEEALYEALRAIWSARHSLESLSCEAVAASHDWTWQAAARKLSDALKFGLAQAG